MTFKTGDLVRNTRTFEHGTVVESYNGKPPRAGYAAVVYDEDPNVWEVPDSRLELIEDQEPSCTSRLELIEDQEPSCTCQLAPVHSTDIDPPDMILDHHCPVHGDGGPDPDAQRDDRLARLAENV